MVRKLIIVLLSFVLFAAASYRTYLSFTPANPLSTQPQSFVISRGQTATSIAHALAQSGLIKSQFAFKIASILTASSQKLARGEYLLSPSMTLFEIIDKLTKGPTSIWVTLPEGLRKEEIALKISQSPDKFSSFSPEEFVSIATAQSLEGTLFPDTYLFSREATATSIVDKLKETFSLKAEPILAARKSTLSREQTITVASLLEREVSTYSDQQLVAGIIVKRLNSGWTLDIDASLQYQNANNRCFNEVDCKWWQPITPEEKNIITPYNVYKTSSLPPTPISNPGLGAIKAASNPTESEYWFYLSDPEGKTHFARTLSEHSSNVARYLKP